ncbi:MAG: tyrosine-protein phosphatase [Bacteroidota bacterium]
MNTDTTKSKEFYLQSQPNFRDLGGIITKSGKFIKPGLLFRSGDLHSVSDDDIARLEKAGLANIIDFRSDREREWRPDKPISTIKKTIHLTIPDAVRDMATELIQQGDEEGLKTLLISEYRRMVTDHIGEFSAFLDLLVTTDDLPLVFHCAAGKDRTGLATIFLLTALGVRNGVIIENYYATNAYNAKYAAKIIGKINEMGHNGELMRPMLEVRPEYLEAALDEIDEKYDGLEEYVTITLKADVERLRERFLE